LRRTVAATEGARPFGNSRIDQALHVLPMGLSHQRPHFGLRIEGIAYSESFGGCDKCRDKLVMDFPLNQKSGACRAALPRVAEPSSDCRCRSLGDVGIGEHDIGALAAELERYALDPIGGELDQARAGARLARERDLVD
jgi:hypothetical protein